ncbi:MAG: hypothetical protein PHS96_01010 [Anaerolineales bacterium]|nr:hypothetical protein [Anaerolineales bacterium]
MNGADRLSETVNRFCQFIEAIPPQALGEQDWGPKEVLAHLVYHHELYVSLAEAYLVGAPMTPPTGRFCDLNAAAIAASRGVSPATLVSRLQKANRRLVELYQLHDPEKIIIEIKAGAKLRSLGQLVQEVEAHIRNHLCTLRKELLER